MTLTRRQREILDYIREFIRTNHFPPSIRDIAAHFSLASAGGVHKHLNNLKKKGVIAFENHISRSIHLLDAALQAEQISDHHANGESMMELPLLGKVAAGKPIQYFLENETISLPAAMVRNPAKSYVLQVQGNSMIEDCICDGDYVIVEHRDYAENGDTIIAMLNHEEATLKRFYLEKDRVRLQPANFQMEPLYVQPEKLTVQGRVVGLLRRY